MENNKEISDNEAFEMFGVGLQAATKIMSEGGPLTKVQMLCALGSKDIIIEFRNATKEEIEDCPSGFTTYNYDPMGDISNEQIN
jgi:hypothetical protein